MPQETDFRSQQISPERSSRRAFLGGTVAVGLSAASANTLLANGERVELDGVSFSVKEVGPAESHADSYFLVTADGEQPVAFVGDVAFHGTHPYTADGHSTEWLRALEQISIDLSDVKVLYPGHGDPTGPGFLAEQRRYLLYYREVVHRLSQGESTLSEAALTHLDAAMQAFLPDAPLTWMVGLGANAVASELMLHGELDT